MDLLYFIIFGEHVSIKVIDAHSIKKSLDSTYYCLVRQRLGNDCNLTGKKKKYF